jgi:hypothetical protein
LNSIIFGIVYHVFAQLAFSFHTPNYNECITLTNNKTFARIEKTSIVSQGQQLQYESHNKQIPLVVHVFMKLIRTYHVPIRLIGIYIVAMGLNMDIIPSQKTTEKKRTS